MNCQSIDKYLEIISTTKGQTEDNKNVSPNKPEVNNRDDTSD